MFINVLVEDEIIVDVNSVGYKKNIEVFWWLVILYLF